MSGIELAGVAHGVEPLQTVTARGGGAGAWSVEDGAGRVYARQRGGNSFRFRAAGALGRHVVRREGGAGVASAAFEVNCRTAIRDRGGVFRNLLDGLVWTMQASPGDNFRRFNGRFYRPLHWWLRDGVHAMKGKKYFGHWGDALRDHIDVYADSQCADGMIFDNFYPHDANGEYHDYAFGPRFVRSVEQGDWRFLRVPVENDVEYLFVEGLYFAWKATGDDAWMKGRLDNAMKALRYTLHSPYRWSKRLGLLKRGYTIDTWDFQSGEDAARAGHAMRIDLKKTRFGIMHGDNTGFAAACRFLAEMMEHAGRAAEAPAYRRLADTVLRRLDALAWNGAFFRHHVPEDARVMRDLGVDEASQVSLSNAYALNRGLPHGQCVRIIRTYQRIRREMPASSPGEFYLIYPPFERGFGHANSKWEYMNGGVSSLVAGELAHGAFEHGFEAYGADILARTADLVRRHRGLLPVTLRGAMPVAPRRRFVELDLAPVANVDFRGVNRRGAIGWTGEGPRNDLGRMPTGARTYHDIPFRVLDPATNGRRACVGLSSQGAYARTVIVRVGRKAASLYLLHTAAGSVNPAGTLTFRYADGSESAQYVGQDLVDNWWGPADLPGAHQGYWQGMPRRRVAWRGANGSFNNIGVFACGIDNPQPAKRITELRFDAAVHGGKWFILGATVSDKPVFFMPPEVSFGIPHDWGAGAVVYALVEGLAGVKDAGVAFDRALIAPRWDAAGIHQAEATIKYESSGGYVRYRYARRGARTTLQFTGSADETEVRFLVARKDSQAALRVDGEPSPVRWVRIESSHYACVTVHGAGAHRVDLRSGAKPVSR